MSLAPKFYLVDKSGNPLSQRVLDATQELGQNFLAFESKIGDSAVVSDCVEQTAIKVEAHERTHGPIQNLTGYFLRSFANAIKSKLRNGNHHTIKEAPMSDKVLEIRAAPNHRNSAETIERRILLEQTLQILRQLDEDKQELLFMAAHGYSAKNIAGFRGMTETNVNTSLHRARVEARRVLKDKVLPNPVKRY